MKKLLYCLILCVMGGVFFSGCAQKYYDNRATKIHDVNCYMYENYLNQETYKETFIAEAGGLASKFFPKYSEIDFNYKAIDFYIYGYDVNDTFSVYPDVTFVLELSFENSTDYQVLLDSINSEYKFLEEPIKDGWSYLMPVAEFELGAYDCKVVKYEEKFLHKVYPDSVQIVCTNESSLMIRYLYCYDADQDIINEKEFIKSIKLSTFCEW